ncbi:hypothetical protein CC80DRAFT_495530 [Byssothecium circinans]|uniref:Uncharacterized protein n=1 Tax=Byssothecium circinans TaxID=147558 RepID=A0A6A5TIJ2_9PLEO|nr:hypothetical protein CC80DRAFT_495530 [Byssothecium circinans]
MAPAPKLMARTVFEKRDEIAGFDIPPLVIVLLCMVASGILLVMCYGVARFAFPDETQGPKEASAAQLDYMREVRARNLDGLMADGAHARYLEKRGDVQR